MGWWKLSVAIALLTMAALFISIKLRKMVSARHDAKSFYFACRLVKIADSNDSVRGRVGVVVVANCYVIAEERARDAVRIFLSQENIHFSGWKEGKWTNGRLLDRKVASAEGAFVSKLFEDALKSPDGISIQLWSISPT